MEPNGLFSLVLIKIADILAPKLAVVFRILVRQGYFPVFWRTANVTTLLVKHLFSFVDRSNVLSLTQFGFINV